MARTVQDEIVSEEKVQVGPALGYVGRILRQHAGGLLAVGLALLVPLELIGAALTSGNPDVPRTGAPVGTDVISGLIKLEPIVGDLLVLVFAVPVIAGAVALLTAATLVERPMGVSSALRGASRRAAPLALVTVTLILGIAIVASVAGLVDAVIPQLLPSGSIASVTAAMVILIGTGALLPFALVAYPAAMMHGGTAADPVRSAVRIAREGFVMLLGRAIAVLVIASLLGTVARSVVMLLVGLVSSGPFANAIGEAVADAVFIPLFGAGATVVYLDQRGRRGEIDHATLAEEVERAA